MAGWQLGRSKRIALPLPLTSACNTEQLVITSSPPIACLLIPGGKRPLTPLKIQRETPCVESRVRSTFLNLHSQATPLPVRHTHDAGILIRQGSPPCHPALTPLPGMGGPINSLLSASYIHP